MRILSSCPRRGQLAASFSQALVQPSTESSSEPSLYRALGSGGADMSAERRTVPTLPCDVSCFFSPSEARDFLLGAPACPSLSYMQFFIPPLPVPRVTLGDQSSKPGTEPVVSLHPGDSRRDQRSRPLRVGRLPSPLLEASSLSGRDSAPWLRSQVLRPHTVPPPQKYVSEAIGFRG